VQCFEREGAAAAHGDAHGACQGISVAQRRARLQIHVVRRTSNTRQHQRSRSISAAAE
jgi:hypothetical protein